MGLRVFPFCVHLRIINNVNLITRLLSANRCVYGSMIVLFLWEDCGFRVSTHVFDHITDPPILSSSPRNGSGTAMNADLSLVEQSDSSACPARSLQNVPVRPPIAQSTPAFFCTFLCISQKFSTSQRLRAGCSLDTEGIGIKSQEEEGSLFCSEVAVGEPIERLRFVLTSCVRLR